MLLSGWLDSWSVSSVWLSPVAFVPTPFHPFTFLQKYCTEDTTAETHTWEHLSISTPSTVEIFQARRVRSWNLSVVPPHNNGDPFSLFKFQCEAIHCFCPVPCDLTSAIILVRWWEAPKADQPSKRNLSHCTPTFAHTLRETHTSKCPPSPFGGTVYKLVCPLLTTVGIGGGGVFWIWRDMMKAVCTVFSFC